MKVLAINGSPHGGKGNTALILDPFLEGLRDAGADVELVCTRDLDINPCLGCFGCWIKTPGQCVQKDDMAELLPRLREADLWALASPLYFDGPSAPLKNVMDRMTAFLRLAAEVRGGRSRHLVEDEVKGGRVVLVSNCGLWEIGNFEPLVAQVKGFCRHVDREFVGALLRPHGQTLRDILRRGEPVDDVLEAARQAGRQLARERRISKETLDIVGRELVSLKEYLESMNQKAKGFESRLDGK
ncbi:MAG TPA: flavodoxin family protein [Anaerolineae bacterium]|nr:flavodoxin family protein [Anaerolineae bacterium]